MGHASLAGFWTRRSVRGGTEGDPGWRIHVIGSAFIHEEVQAATATVDRRIKAFPPVSEPHLLIESPELMTFPPDSSPR